MKIAIALLVVAVASTQGFSISNPMPGLFANLSSTVTTAVANVVDAVKAAKAIHWADWTKMSDENKIKHFRVNCTDEVAHLDDAAITANVAASLEKSESLKALMGDLFTHEEGVNCMSAWSHDDVMKILKTNPNQEANSRVPSAAAAPIPQTRQAAPAPPASVDWRTKGYVNAVKNQGQCGSCWSFSANGAMEGAVFKKTGKLPNMAEQNLVDCVTASSGCNGGWMTDAYDYSIKNGGVDNQTSYAYIAKQNPTCKYAAASNVGKVASWNYTNQDDEVDLKAKLATVGPVAIAIDASHIQNYVSGVFSCTGANNFTAVNHGVLAVGYGTDTTTTPPTDYYIVRNSWGPSWGESGYIRIVRNKGSAPACGIPTYANYPVA